MYMNKTHISMTIWNIINNINNLILVKINLVGYLNCIIEKKIITIQLLSFMD